MIQKAKEIYNKPDDIPNDEPNPDQDNWIK
jgi:hypothetical protein